MKELEISPSEMEEMLTDMVAEVMADMEDEQIENSLTLEDVLFEDDESDEEIELQDDDDDTINLEDDEGGIELEDIFGQEVPEEDDSEESYEYSFPTLSPEEGGDPEDISVDEPELLELTTVAADDPAIDLEEEFEEDWDETMAADYDYDLSDDDLEDLN